MNRYVAAAEASAAPAVPDTFMDLICQDDDLVRAEFDALVAATWHTPPEPPPAPPRRPPPEARHAAPPDNEVGRPAGNTPRRRTWRRQRAPP